MNSGTSPLDATPDVYARLADGVRPGAGTPPAAAESAVSGRVDAASAAALDRAMLRFWASLKSEEAMRRHWGAAAAAAP